MELREKVRERQEAKLFAMDTLRSAIEWVKETNPQMYLTAEGAKKERDDIMPEEEFRGKMRDWIAKSGDLIEKTWELPTLLVDDAIKLLTEQTETKDKVEIRAEQERTPTSE